MVELTKFDAADYLDDPETQAHFINEAIEGGDPALIKKALDTVARARGMSAVAEESGVSRKGVYNALSEDGDPRLSTLTDIMKALGLQITVAPIENARAV